MYILALLDRQLQVLASPLDVLTDPVIHQAITGTRILVLQEGFGAPVVTGAATLAVTPHLAVRAVRLGRGTEIGFLHTFAVNVLHDGTRSDQCIHQELQVEEENLCVALKRKMDQHTDLGSISQSTKIDLKCESIFTAKQSVTSRTDTSSQDES